MVLLLAAHYSLERLSGFSPYNLPVFTWVVQYFIGINRFQSVCYFTFLTHSRSGHKSTPSGTTEMAVVIKKPVGKWDRFAYQAYLSLTITRGTNTRFTHTRWYKNNSNSFTHTGVSIDLVVYGCPLLCHGMGTVLDMYPTVLPIISNQIKEHVLLPSRLPTCVLTETED